MIELLKQIDQVFSKGKYTEVKKELKRLGFVPAEKAGKVGKTSLVDIFNADREIEFPGNEEEKLYIEGSIFFGVKDLPNYAFLYWGVNEYSEEQQDYFVPHLHVYIKEITSAELSEVLKISV